jgi:thiol-disulfide isomerase/thioredoxin
MNRRNLIVGAAGVLAAGAGLAWQLSRSSKPAPGSAADGAPNEFVWGARFARPEGGELVMASLRGRPLVLNFWATWCPPCVKEMPEIDRFSKAFATRGGLVIGLAVDNLAAVRQFLAHAPVSYGIGVVGGDGVELSRRLGNAGGALPFTAVFDRQGRVAERRVGSTNPSELERWTQAL